MSAAKQHACAIAREGPMVSAEAAKAMGGLAFLRAMQKGEVPLPPICELMGFELTEVEDRMVFGCVPRRATPQPDRRNPRALACTLLDSAMDCAPVAAEDRNLMATLPVSKPSARSRGVLAQWRECRPVSC